MVQLWRVALNSGRADRGTRLAPDASYFPLKALRAGAKQRVKRCLAPG